MTYRYSYDNEGNLSRRVTISTGAVRDFTWDFRNRLVSVTDRDGTGAVTQELTFTYDALNRRISKGVSANSVNPGDRVTTDFVYDGSNILLDFTQQGSGGQAVLAHRYLHGPTVDQILAAEDGSGAVLWSLTDHLGSVRDLVNAAGTIVDYIVYDSFGRITTETNPILFLFAYTGRELDRETGLQYHRARFYDPATGRFNNEDPLSFGAGGTNLYMIASNDPIAFRGADALLKPSIHERQGASGCG